MKWQPLRNFTVDVPLITKSKKAKKQKLNNQLNRSLKQFIVNVIIINGYILISFVEVVISFVLRNYSRTL